jgi:hypothetical protein
MQNSNIKNSKIINFLNKNFFQTNFFRQNYFEAGIITTVFLACFVGSFKVFGVGAFSDSPAYILNIVMVAPLYPIIIDVLQWLFGEDNMRSITIAQFFITFPILGFALFKISKLLDVNNVIKGFILIFIGVFFHMFCSKIMTEAFAYPLFYLVFAYIMEVFIKKTPKSFVIACILAVILYLIRSQFIIIFGFLLLILIGFCIYNKKDWLKAKLFLVFFASIFVAAFFNQSVNYFLHGKFIGPQGGGIVLSASPSYFATAEDVNLFNDDVTKQFYVKYFDKLQQINAIKNCDKSKWKNVTQAEIDQIEKSFPNWTNENYKRWLQAFDDIIKNSKENIYKTEIINNKCTITDATHAEYVGDLYTIFAALYALDNMNITDWPTIGSITTEVGIKLRAAHFKEWLTESYLKTIYFNTGGYFMVILALIVFFSTASSYKKEGKLSAADIFLIMSLTTHISLVLFVSFIAMVHDRYFVYSFLLVAGSIILVLEKFRLKYFPNF